MRAWLLSGAVVGFACGVPLTAGDDEPAATVTSPHAEDVGLPLTPPLRTGTTAFPLVPGFRDVWSRVPRNHLGSVMLSGRGENAEVWWLVPGGELPALSPAVRWPRHAPVTIEWKGRTAVVPPPPEFADHDPCQTITGVVLAFVDLDHDGVLDVGPAGDRVVGSSEFTGIGARPHPFIANSCPDGNAPFSTSFPLVDDPMLGITACPDWSPEVREACGFDLAEHVVVGFGTLRLTEEEALPRRAQLELSVSTGFGSVPPAFTVSIDGRRVEGGLDGLAHLSGPVLDEPFRLTLERNGREVWAATVVVPPPFALEFAEVPATPGAPFSFRWKPVPFSPAPFVGATVGEHRLDLTVGDGLARGVFDGTGRLTIGLTSYVAAEDEFRIFASAWRSLEPR